MIIHMVNCVLQDPMSISHATFSLTFSLPQFQYMHMVDKKTLLQTIPWEVDGLLSWFFLLLHCLFFCQEANGVPYMRLGCVKQ